MIPTWKLNDLQRQAVAKRGELGALNAQLERLDGLLVEARDFEGHFNERLAAADRRVGEVAMLYEKSVSGLSCIGRGDPDEWRRRVDERAQIERERDEERARRTTTASDGFRTLYFCELRPADVVRKRAGVVIVRDRIRRELDDVESQLTPGEVVQSGVPASAYAEHVARTASARERAGIAGA